MQSMKKSVIFATILALVFAFLSYPAMAADEKEKLSQERKDSIIERCGAIQETLKATQRFDSYARTYLGSVYEKFLSDFLTPLNVRLLKNNQSISSLTDLQTEFVDERTKFNSEFVTYSKTLEDLVNTSCTNDPQTFYTKLQKTREEREKVDKATEKLEKMMAGFKEKVKEIEIKK